MEYLQLGARRRTEEVLAALGARAAHTHRNRRHQLIRIGVLRHKRVVLLAFVAIPTAVIASACGSSAPRALGVLVAPSPTGAQGSAAASGRPTPPATR